MCVQGMAEVEIWGWKLGRGKDLREVLIAGKVSKFQLTLYGTADLRTGQEELGFLVYDYMSLKDSPLRTLVSHCLRISSCFSMIVVCEIWAYRVTVWPNIKCKVEREMKKRKSFFWCSPNRCIS